MKLRLFCLIVSVCLMGCASSGRAWKNADGVYQWEAKGSQEMIIKDGEFEFEMNNKAQLIPKDLITIAGSKS